MSGAEQPRYLVEAESSNGFHDLKTFPNIHRARGWCKEFREHAALYSAYADTRIYELREVKDEI